MRKSGILMHISSLPGEYSCGSFGKEAYKFIDLLKGCGFGVWQTLPFGMPDIYGSPYKSYSAFAGNPWFIDLESLFEKGLISKADLDGARQKDKWLCEFDRFDERLELLFKAAKNADCDEEIEGFLKENPDIDAFCRFMATKSANNGCELWDFDPAIQMDAEVYRAHAFIQYEFDRQWQRLKAYANENGVLIIGDLPIYVDTDSADVWANPKNFQIDERKRPKRVAGVPPDYFSEDGQLWGNPLYDWDYMKKEGYGFWKRRIARSMHLFDGVRIDHFRAFSDYFSIDADAKTAKEGKWVKGPGLPLIKALKEIAGDKLIIAEDLGVQDERVIKLLERSGLPGMRVFQFAFLDGDDHHRPHSYPKNCVAYTGTHDNNTLLGYLWELDDETRRYMLDYCGYEGDWKQALPAMIKTVLRSHSDLVIMPIQDVLGFGEDTRMNTPGCASGNWRYRVAGEQLDRIDMAYWSGLMTAFSRK